MLLWENKFELVYLSIKFEKMSLQIIQGGNGKPTGVFIPINDWESMKKENQNLKAWEEPELTKSEILSGLKDAIEEVKLIKSGKVKAKSLKDFLNEL